MESKLVVFGVFCLFVAGTSAATCTSPTVKATSFTTTQGTIVSQVAFISEFSLKCGNGAEKVPLFAEVEGRLFPVARTSDDRYQVSWSEEVKKASSGNHEVNLYDEEGYGAYRKAQRSGEKVNVKPLAKLNVYHSGTFKGAWVKSELVATVLIGVAAYVAFATKNKLIN